ncbi:MAG: hypothetical protein CL928_11730 [Deltaproteobacteria bacterium]|nr:hypothetical protein [Deltaproteobacteria bacterium]
MRLSRTLVCLSYGLLFAILLAAAVPAPVEARSQLIDRIVAVVDQEVVLWSELNMRLQVFLQASGYTFTPPVQELDRLREQMLDDMVDEQVLILKAKRDSLEIDHSRVEELLGQEVKKMKEASGDDYKGMLERIGFTERQLKTHLRKTIRDQMLMDQMQQVIAARVNVTRRDVEAFRQAHADTLPSTFYVSLIFRKVRPDTSAVTQVLETVVAVEEKLAAGADFAELAREYSEDPGSREEGGYLDCFRTGDFVPEFERAAFALRPGEVSAPVRTEYGYHLILLHEKREDELCASHILVRTGTDDSDKDRVRAELDELRERALAGEDFAELARQHSEDPSAELGGLWNIYDKGDIPPFLQSHLGPLSLGGITEPFLLEDGGRLLKINDDQATIERMIRERLIPVALQEAISEFKQQIHLDRRNASAANEDE